MYLKIYSFCIILFISYCKAFSVSHNLVQFNVQIKVENKVVPYKNTPCFLHGGHCASFCFNALKVNGLCGNYKEQTYVAINIYSISPILSCCLPKTNSKCVNERCDAYIGDCTQDKGKLFLKHQNLKTFFRFHGLVSANLSILHALRNYQSNLLLILSLQSVANIDVSIF
jgi:hypothetical protein